MQEEVNHRTVALSIKATKLTGKALAMAMAAALRQMRRARDAPHHGKQTVKQLARQNAGLTSIPVTQENIGGFERVARKYGVDFAPYLDDRETPPKWLVFFKSRDADAMTAAFSEFSRDILHREKAPERSSVVEAIRSFKERVNAAVLSRSKVRERGGPEL